MVWIQEDGLDKTILEIVHSSDALVREGVSLQIQVGHFAPRVAPKKVNRKFVV